MSKDLEDAKVFLLKRDKKTLEERAERLFELRSAPQMFKDFSSQRVWDYSEEASNAYIYGNYRGAIFCCTAEVDQIFRYEYVKAGKEYKDLERLTFGGIITKCEKGKVKSVIPFVEKARLLNNIRNTVAAHPAFIDVPYHPYTEEGFRERSLLLVEDMKVLLNQIGKIDPEQREEIENEEIIDNVKGQKYPLGDVVYKNLQIQADSLKFLHSSIEETALKFLANSSWQIAKAIIEGLYPS